MAIKLSNGHEFEYMVASGALSFAGRGWWWEKPLVWLGIIRPELFTIVLKSLTTKPRKGNLRWWKPWTCVRLIKGGAVNKVGLTNKGIDWWCEKVAPTIDFQKYKIVASIFGTEEELVVMALTMNQYDLVALEVNCSCPNSGDPLDEANTVIRASQSVRAVSRHPLITKVSAAQDCPAIAKGLEGVAEAISLNSVPYEMVFLNGPKSPLWRLEKKVGGGGGGVSGKPAQQINWRTLRFMTDCSNVPIIGPSVMRYEDLDHLRKIGAKAFSFGTIFLRTPWRPTQIVLKDMKTNKK